MNIKPESLIKAAKLLQKHCRSVDPCDENSNCLFYDKESGNCLIKTFPTNWDLDKIQERVKEYPDEEYYCHDDKDK